MGTEVQNEVTLVPEGVEGMRADDRRAKMCWKILVNLSENVEFPKIARLDDLERDTMCGTLVRNVPG